MWKWEMDYEYLGSLSDPKLKEEEKHFLRKQHLIEDLKTGVGWDFVDNGKEDKRK